MKRERGVFLKFILSSNDILIFIDYNGLILNKWRVAIMNKSTVIAVAIIAVFALGGGGIYAAEQIARSNAIDEAAALNFACIDAGVSAEEAIVTEAKFKLKRGKYVYKLEFNVNETEYEYVVDSSNGEIIEKEIEKMRDAANTKQPVISSEEARSIALKKVGVSDGEAEMISVEIENKKYVYDIEFVYGETKYEYEIDVVSGEVREESSKSVKEKSGQKDMTAAISIEDAKSIALKDKGFSADQVVFSKERLKRDDGRTVYDIEFYVKGQAEHEYEYEIDANTGGIIEAESDN